MKEYIAMDVHKRYSLLERENRLTGKVHHQRIEHSRGAICAVLKDCEPQTPVAVEATGNWYWIIAELDYRRD